MKAYDVIGIGNPLLDFVVEVDDGVLAQVDLRKGSMQLIDYEQSKGILQKLETYHVTTSPGGSTANVLAAVGCLGGSSLLMGKVGEDAHADLYEQGLNISHVTSKLKREKNIQTGHAITFITPDSERTFATHLGAALHFSKEDVFAEEIRNAKFLHLEGFQLEPIEQRLSARHAMHIAKQEGVKISIDLSDGALIDRAGAPMELLIHEYADILFANETEAKHFTGLEEEEAALALAQLCETVVVKLGEEGSILVHKGKATRIEPVKIAVRNTNGAGDMYAGAFLWSLAHGKSHEHAARIASWAAAQACASPFARVEKSLAEEVKSVK